MLQRLFPIALLSLPILYCSTHNFHQGEIHLPKNKNYTPLIGNIESHIEIEGQGYTNSKIYEVSDEQESKEGENFTMEGHQAVSIPIIENIEDSFPVLSLHEVSPIKHSFSKASESKDLESLLQHDSLHPLPCYV